MSGNLGPRIDILYILVYSINETFNMFPCEMPEES